MQYNTDIENYWIKITGTTDEIRQVIIALDKVITRGNEYSQLEKDLNNLKNITKEKSFAFNLYEKIHYDKNSITYLTDATLSARPSWFVIVQQHFDKALLLLNKDQD